VKCNVPEGGAEPSIKRRVVGRVFCTVGSAAFAFASGRARRSTLAGLAVIVISSPVAGFRPLRAFCAGFTRTVSCTRPPIRLLRVPELLENDLLEHAEHSLRLGAADFGAVSDGARELCLGQRQRNSSVERCGRTGGY
jgi:hypothetical protein